MSKQKGLELKYFVLSPNKTDAYGNASRKAILEYAKTIQERNPILFKDLVNWIGSLNKTRPIKKFPDFKL